MRPYLHPLLAGLVLSTFTGACTVQDNLLDHPGTAGSDGGTDSNAGSGGSGAQSTAGTHSSGSGGRAGSGTAGAHDGGSSGSAEGGVGAEGGVVDHGGSAGTSGAGGTHADAGTSGTGGTSGASSCPPGEIWCPGCVVGSGACGDACPTVECTDCSMVETLEACEQRTDCHSVFEDPGTCGCAGVGCCAKFSRCADNDLADCTGADVMCEAPTPYCENPAFVNSFSGFCYEGCVDPKDCAPAPPTPCPSAPPVDGAACGGDTECYYDACPEGGRAIARCSDRHWSVETGTSCAVQCSGVGQSCNEGEICLVHAGGALLVDCVENGCGTGPILEECAGNCPVSFTLDGGATATCNTCPQGGCP